MEHVFAVKDQDTLVRYQAFLREIQPWLEEYIRFLVNRRLIDLLEERYGGHPLERTSGRT